MAQTKEGVRKIKAKYGADHFRTIGKLGGNPILLLQRDIKLANKGGDKSE